MLSSLARPVGRHGDRRRPPNRRSRGLALDGLRDKMAPIGQKKSWTRRATPCHCVTRLDIRESSAPKRCAKLRLSSQLFRAALPVAVLMTAMAMTHTTHAMNGSSAGVNVRSATDTFHRAGVALAKASGAVAMDAAFTMNVLTM